MLKFGSGKINI